MADRPALDLTVIRADLQQISPWPWRARVVRPKEPEEILDLNGGIVVGEVGEPIFLGDDEDGSRWELRKRNAHFLATAPERIAALAGEVEQLRRIEAGAATLTGAVLARRWELATVTARRLSERAAAWQRALERAVGR